MNAHCKLLLSPGRLLATMSIVALASASGCSRQPASDSADGAASAPLVTASSESRRADDVLTSEITAGGVSATYRATFTNDQLQRIVETRDSNAIAAQRKPATGEYEFYGARLTKYAGAAPGSNATIELEFDLRGAVIAARPDSGAASADVIGAIRTRAQLLRSHALTQRALRSHGKT